MREVLNGTLYLARTELFIWRNDGTLALMNFVLVRMAHELESGGVCGYDVGKKIKGRKRHVLTDTNGFLVGVVVHEANIQDRDGAVFVLQSIRRFYPFLRHVFLPMAVMPTTN